MQNKLINIKIASDLGEFELPELPNEIIDSHGMPMNISGDIWEFNVPSHDMSFDFNRRKIVNPWLLYSQKRHLIRCLLKISPIESYNIIRLNTLWMSRCPSWDSLCHANSIELHSVLMSSVMSEALENLRRDNVLYNFSRLRAWYRWCVDYLPDMGFDPDEAYKWEQIHIPGNEKGLAVRTEDPDGGPLNDAELIQLRSALQRDMSMESEHVKQRAALWLSLVYGRNPSNYAQLRVGDFRRLAETEEDEIWTLNIPRIKKRTLPRIEFKSEYVDQVLGKIIRELIDFGDPESLEKSEQRPLFVRNSPRGKLIGTAMNEWAWHMTTSEFTSLIRAGVKRYGLISPRTNEPLSISTRRLRYTFATNRVREGVSAMDLAEMLDHTDLQNVRVYFDTRSTIVERLDRAAAKEIAPMLQLFKGKIVKNSSDADNGFDTAKRIRIIPELISTDRHLNDLGSCGKKEFCMLYPPYSCYPCDRFQPFSDSLDVHEMVFDFLIERRERLRGDPLESSRIAVQLDEVIYACAAVVRSMQGKDGENASK